MREQGRILGVVLFGFGMGGALGVSAVGRWYDARHNYDVAFVALAVTAAIATALAALVEMPALRRSLPRVLDSPRKTVPASLSLTVRPIWSLVSMGLALG
jgi:pimeloyl-ACP methyl ester carboxylesterase